MRRIERGNYSEGRGQRERRDSAAAEGAALCPSGEWAWRGTGELGAGKDHPCWLVLGGKFSSTPPRFF